MTSSSNYHVYLYFYINIAMNAVERFVTEVCLKKKKKNIFSLLSFLPLFSIPDFLISS